MLCESCKQKPATVHITKIVNGQKTEFHFCEECARNSQHTWGMGGLEPNFSLSKFLASLAQPEFSFPSFVSPTAPQCGRCGLTYERFSQTGKLGCGECYHYFARELDSLFRRIHGSNLHRGKIPRRVGGKVRLQQEIEKLKAELKVLVANEEFERAAQVRDKIRELEKRLEAQQAEGR